MQTLRRKIRRDAVPVPTAPSSSYTQNWDSVTAPSAAFPGWVLDPAITTTTTPYATTPFSSPNVLTCSTTGAWKYATYQTADGNNGDVTVTGTFAQDEHFFPTPPYTGFWGWAVFARGSSSTLSGTTTQYEGRITFDSQVAAIYADVGGVQTELGWTSFQITRGIMHQMSLQVVGHSPASLQLSVQRMSDGFWLDSVGLWFATPAVAVSTTDSSITGSGYAGLGLYTNSGAVFADDFILANYPPSSFMVLPGVGWPKRRRIEDRNVTRLFG